MSKKAVFINPKLHSVLRLNCAINGITITRAIELAIADYLEKNKTGDMPAFNITIGKQGAGKKLKADIGASPYEQMLIDSGEDVPDFIDNENGIGKILILGEVKLSRYEGFDGLAKLLVSLVSGDMKNSISETESFPIRALRDLPSHIVVTQDLEPVNETAKKILSLTDREAYSKELLYLLHCKEFGGFCIEYNEA